MITSFLNVHKAEIKKEKKKDEKRRPLLCYCSQQDWYLAHISLRPAAQTHGNTLKYVIVRRCLVMNNSVKEGHVNHTQQ